MTAASRTAARQAASGRGLRVAVVGAGAFGGWTALQLRERGCEVVLVDAWGPGNTRSSSGGETRVIRAIYGQDRVYVEMVRRSYERWETLDAADHALYLETGALWLHRGDDAYVRSSVPVLRDLGFSVEQLTITEAKRKYPQISFAGIKSVWLEGRAGALSARRACAVVRDAFASIGGTYRMAMAAPEQPLKSGSLKTLRLADGSSLAADVYVFACGPWLGRLFPDLIGNGVLPTRQEVFYFGTPQGSDRYAPPRLPIWIDFGERIVYGIPDVRGHGFKIADDTRGEPFDPTSGNRVPTTAGINAARQVLAERFPEMANAPLIASEVCQYENTPDGNLIIDRHPQVSNLWFVGGGSGHGFKLSPAVGELVATAIVGGGKIPELFQLGRLRDLDKRTTQFDRKSKS